MIITTGQLICCFPCAWLTIRLQLGFSLQFCNFNSFTSSWLLNTTTTTYYQKVHSGEQVFGLPKRKYTERQWKQFSSPIDFFFTSSNLIYICLKGDVKQRIWKKKSTQANLFSLFCLFGKGQFNSSIRRQRILCRGRQLVNRREKESK